MSYDNQNREPRDDYYRAALVEIEGMKKECLKKRVVDLKKIKTINDTIKELKKNIEP